MDRKKVKSGVKTFMTYHKSGVDQIQDWLGEKSFTTSLGGSVGAGLGRSSINLSGTLGFDSRGNITLQGAFGLGVTTSPVTWSAGLNASITNAPDYTKLEGNGLTIGGSALFPLPNLPAVGVGGGADMLIIPEGENDWKYTGGMGSVLIGSPGFEGHAEYGRTGTADSYSFNIFDEYNKLYEKVISWASN